MLFQVQYIILIHILDVQRLWIQEIQENVFFSCKITCLSVCILFRQNIHVLIVNYRIYKLKYKYWYSYFNKSLTFAPSICFWHRFHVHRRRQYHCDQPVLLSLRVPAVRPIVHAVAHSTTPPAVRVRRAETLRMCALQQLVSPQRYAGQAHGKQARHLNRKKKTEFTWMVWRLRTSPGSSFQCPWCPTIEVNC